MATTIRVLIVEDSGDDAELEIYQLRRSGYDPVWRRVDTIPDLLAALNDPYDLILADYRLPTFTGLDVLHLLRAQGSTIPLLLISGTIGEELAVECVKQGASDYLLKDRLARLGSAVERALAEAAMQRAKAEVDEALRQSEAHYRAIVDSPFALICRWLPDGRLTYANETYAAVFGLRAADLMGLSWADLLPPADRSSIEAAYADLLQVPQPTTIEHPVIDGEGRRRLIVWTDYPIFDAEGKLVEFQSVGQDVTELRTVKQQIQLLSQAVEQSPVSTVITDRNGIITYVNPYCLALTGYSEAELLGRNPSIMQSGLTPLTVYRQLWQTIVAGQPWRGEMQNRRKNGELIWVSLQISPILDSQGAITHFVAVQEDITERKTHEANLRRLNEQLEQRVEERTAELSAVNAALQRTVQARDFFLASMSHELRTPLTGILGITEGLEDYIYGPLTDRQLRSVQAVRSSGEHLLGLINDILDVAKAEAGLLPISFDDFSVDDVCQASLSLVRGMAQKKRLRITYSLSPAAIRLEADARRIKQILVNLLSNAVKFTPEEGRVGLEVVADTDTQTVSFLVWDTGIGIAEEDMPRLFQPFAQLDASLAREYAGSGLGLSLVRNMAELHGGGIRVESAVGQGSRFTVTLPWRHSAPASATALATGEEQQAEETPVAPTADRAGGGPLLLLADDDAATLEAYKAYLEAGGYQVVTARHGNEAVHVAQSRHPALILMDIQMPGMDGLTLIRRLRASPDAAVAAAPILALTALAMPGDRERCLAAGADDYLSKPVALPKLAEAISTLLKQRRA